MFKTVTESLSRFAEGQKSLAYSFTYRNAEKTLKDKEVNAAHDQLVAELAEKLSATIRDT